MQLLNVFVLQFCFSSELILLPIVFCVWEDVKGFEYSVIVCPSEICFFVFLISCLSFSYSCNFFSGILRYVPPCELNKYGCSEWYMTGWISTELGEINTSIPFSGKLLCFVFTYYLITVFYYGTVVMNTA